MAPQTKPDEAQVKEKSVEQLLKELADKNLQIAELEAQNATLAESQGSQTGKFERNAGSATRHKKLWPFKVSVKNDRKMPDMKIMAVDETEAIRQYVLKADPTGNPLDTVKYNFTAECLEPEKRMKHAADQHDVWRLGRGYGPAPKQGQASQQPVSAV
jgi:hypothetical protein